MKINFFINTDAIFYFVGGFYGNETVRYPKISKEIIINNFFEEEVYNIDKLFEKKYKLSVKFSDVLKGLFGKNEIFINCGKYHSFFIEDAGDFVHVKEYEYNDSWTFTSKIVSEFYFKK